VLPRNFWMGPCPAEVLTCSPSYRCSLVSQASEPFDCFSPHVVRYVSGYLHICELETCSCSVSSLEFTEFVTSLVVSGYFSIVRAYAKGI
jgi:hypothetical protein